MHNNINITLPEGTDFCKRFLDFAKRFDEIKDYNNLLQSATTWVETANYEYIMYFLKPEPYVSLLPFTLTEFIEMSAEQISIWQNYCRKLQNILDEKEALYNELLSYKN